jgi:hypothetical protein
MALQPGVGQSLLLLGFHPEGFLVGKCAFCSEWPAHWPHKFLLNPDETARAIWQAVRRLGWEMATWNLLTDITGSIHAVNLRHGTDGFTSPPKEVVLRIFITLKNSSPSVGIEPADLGSSGEHANHYYIGKGKRRSFQKCLSTTDEAAVYVIGQYQSSLYYWHSEDWCGVVTNGRFSEVWAFDKELV